MVYRLDEYIEDFRLHVLHQVRVPAFTGLDFTLDLCQLSTYLDERIDIVAGAATKNFKL